MLPFEKWNCPCQEAPDTRDLLTRTKRTFRYRLIRELKLAIVASRIRLPRKLGAAHQLFQLQDFLHDSGLISSPSFSAQESTLRILK